MGFSYVWGDLQNLILLLLNSKIEKGITPDINSIISYVINYCDYLLDGF